MLNLVRERKEVTFSFSNGTNLFMVKGKTNVFQRKTKNKHAEKTQRSDEQ
jgi:hypothetical protein